MPSKISHVKICPLNQSQTLYEFIQNFHNLSYSQLKKYSLSKKYLSKIIQAKEEVSLPLDLINRNIINPTYSGVDIELIFEDENVLVLNKPVKIHSHPLRYDENDNLLSFLRMMFHSSLLNVNCINYDRGLLYRLDFETSGVIVYSKTEELYALVRKDIKSVIKKKVYLAVVEGKFNKEGAWIHYLKGSGPNDSIMKISSEEDGGRIASAKFTLLEYNSKNNQSLIKVNLDHGVRHQIRKQLETLGFPILGDSLYNGRAFSRLCLHAWKYELDYKNTYKFEASLPVEFSKLFNFNG